MGKELSQRLSKFLSIVATASLLLNSWAPVFLAPGVVFAQEATPTPEATIAPTESPTESPAITSETTDPTVSPDPSVTPTPQVTATPEVLLPTPSPDSSEPPVLSGNVLVQANEVSSQTTRGPPQLDLGQQVSEASAQLNYSLSTDKADYSPSDTVTITGSNFPVNSNLTVRVTWPDGQVRDAEGNVGSSDTVATDENGSFIFLYPLRGEGQQGSYLVEVLLGATVLATTTFTDSPNPNADLDQCRNGSASSPNNCVDLGGSQGWVNGNAGNTQAHYVEGFSVPYRVRMIELPTDGTIVTIDIGYDIKHGGKHAIDYLTHYDRLEPHGSFGHAAETVDPTSGISGLSATTTTLAIPAPSSSGSPVAGQPTNSFNSLPASERLMTLFGGTITNVAYISEGSLTDNNSETVIQVTFTADSATAVLAWGGHIAKSADWGVGNSATSISGSPYHMRLKDWSLNNLGNQDRSLSAGAVITPGSITVIKDVVPNDSSLWDFTLTGTNFSDSANDLGDGQSHQFSGLTPATYTLSETTDPNYSTSVSCDTGESGSDNVSISLAEAENVTCTFTNEINKGTIIVEKQTIPDSDPTAFTFTGDASGPITDGQQITVGDLLPGTYTSTETIPTGWDLTDISCDDLNSNGNLATKTANFNLEAGETVKCTFTNTKQGKIIVEKQTNPDQSTQVFNFSASYDINGFTLTDGQSNDSGFLSPDTYSVSETVPAGWGLTSATCSDGSNPSSIGLQAGEIVTCTFTNTQKGTIIVEKQTNPDGATGSFTFSGNVVGTISDGGTISVSGLLPGAYTSTESDPTPEFDLTNISCNDSNSSGNLGTRTATFNLESGETVKCTFTNTQRGDISGFKFEDLDGSLGTITDLVPVVGWVIELWSCVTDFNNCTNTGQTATTGLFGFFSFSNLVPGLYQLVEQIQPGWTSLTSDTLNITLNPGESDGNNNFVNTQFGKIIVDKVTNPSGSGQSFDFTLTGGPSGLNQSFGLTDTSTPHNSGDVLPGSGYSIAETVPVGWDLTSATCNDGSPVNNITVSSDETVTCTFTNTQKGTIIVEKQTDPNGATGSFIFTGDVAGTISDGGTISVSGLLPGPYTSTESDPTPGFDLTDISCDDTNSSGDLETATATFSLEAGEIITCTFTNTQRGSITIVKDSNPDDPQDFSYTTTGSGLSSFDLDDDGNNVNDLSNSKTFNNLVSGSYSVTEAAQTGWDLTGLVCDTGETTNLGTRTASITLSPGENVTCTYTNTKHGHIIVDKVTDPSGDPQSFNFDASGGLYANFNLTDAATPNDQELVPGSYSVSETVPAGWGLTSATCDDDDSSNPTSLTLDPGETIHCTFNNQKDAFIIVEKQTLPNGSNQSFEFDPSYANNFSLTDGLQNNSGDLDPGTYSVAEVNVPAGWDLTNTSCTSSKGDSESAGSISLQAGETVTCVFTNTQRGHIIVDKITDPSEDPQEFEFNASGGTDPIYQDFSLTDTDTPNDQELKPGLYSVDETLPVGWDSGDVSCISSNDDIETFGSLELNPGETISCTVNNIKHGKITIEKVTVGGDDDFTFDGDVSGILSNGENSTAEVSPGTYHSTETVPSDWTLTDISCNDSNSFGNLGTSTATFKVEAGEEVTCTFTNTRDTGEIIVNKQVDTNGDGEFESGNNEANELGFRWRIDEETPDREMGTSAGPLDTGVYDVTENNVDGYHFVGWFEGEGTCEDPQETELPAEITVEEDQATEITLCNARDTGDLTILKNVDGNGDGDLNDSEDVLGATDWTWDIADGEQNIATGQTRTLPTGTYTISEDLQEEFALVSWSCLDETSGSINEIVVNLTTEGLTCTFTNQKLIPGISLSKTNDHTSGASGSDIVTYTLVITNTGGGTLHDVRLVDVLPEGFTFVPLTGTPANPDSVSGNILTWNNLGDIAGTASLTVTYKAVIASDIHVGTHTNLAFAQGTGSDTFQSSIVRSLVPVGMGVSLSYDIHQPQVLAAAAELPAAGANTVWLVYVGFLLGAGFGLRRLGLALAPRRKGRAKKHGFWKKFLGSSLVLLLFLLVAQVSPAKAALAVDILDLPSYTSTDTFYISYTALDIEGDAVGANFLVKKDGGTFRSLVNGSTSGATSKVLVTGADFYDGQGKYIFRVEVTGGADTSADETNTIFDHSGPSGVQEYRKERLTDSSYRLFWKNPGDSDFNRVFIYRSAQPEFTADGSTKVGEVGGAPDQQMSWDNFGLESGKTYFYALRAVDHAGNGSGIVADVEAQVTAGAVLAAAATTTTAGAVAGGVEKVKVLPKEEPSEGEILGEEASPSPTAVETPVAEEQGGLLEQLSGNRLLALGVILIVVIGAWVFWPRRPRE